LIWIDSEGDRAHLAAQARAEASLRNFRFRSETG
jgi:hypothetical protein